ncbi:AEC family transporter [Paenarthrobacter aurescens]|uniref:Permease n=1 Tax=Paenarthrobacter aurescens TaxID=43663 RepID=A0A4Y3NEK2_PAEAU|nr:AEC family transporter [Paenarthrobacter aurescens]MDO6145139.1 AEC family transporter [Paenarthrobacter aurescens]MDO6148984.1 AEC family transporter [Paenarthrobacter aurescens]MDO6160230.1 AEC family transporter [Paenarthrobacter aurescens]MDO6164089.1 AEC family transporter [Paenarthrobacter aurescens]GEB20280.1 permease [Paenarthrobacter aurescens]
MIGVLSGFFVVWAIILVGMFVGRRNILGENARSVLSSLTFFVASPALLFETLSKAKLHDVFAAPLLVTAVGAVATGLLFFLLVKFWLKRSLPESLMSSMSASLANSANLGIPIAVFVLGDASYVAPLLIFQLAFFTPMYLMALDASTSSHRTTPLRFLLMIVKNPMIVGSALGLLVAGTGFQVPALILEPIHLIGGAAIPAMLMSFGMSLNGSKPLQKAAGRRLDTLLASGFKLIVHPLIAYVFARFALGMDGHALFAVVVTSALPTAQNVFVAANRYQAGITVAKDTVLITTIVAVPAMIAVALLLA